ncbi:hypothetical protein OOK60_17205 [Trichothermofontia sichuanensis B231]|uniref:hypothetical protein n=1 Tax=Trichothermofontia sichuanensis TaxID=3045816 RepID=UPI002246BD39|nr:hypothetical protein [Trichothermofontia sichuanensis]UZQ54198.1 hypothetical protein OOK60_17205 [Trichothermofontia sichuanensis B231]
MKFWITSFILLFALAELYQWVQHFTLPLPVFILGGAFLAIASNHDKRVGFPGPRPPTGSPPADAAPVSPTPTQLPTMVQPMAPQSPAECSHGASSAASRNAAVQAPTSPFDHYAAGAKATATEAEGGQAAAAAPPRSISFTIDPAKH